MLGGIFCLWTARPPTLRGATASLCALIMDEAHAQQRRRTVLVGGSGNLHAEPASAVDLPVGAPRPEGSDMNDLIGEDQTGILVARDMLTLLLCGFVACAVLAVPFMNDPKKADAQTVRPSARRAM